MAIVLVVAYHSNFPWLAGGYIGVDVFFVLSGYLITGLLLEELRDTGRIDLVRFYARRARRLLPASFATLLLVILASWLLLSPVEQAYFARTALATSVYLSNLWFIRQSTDYLASGAEGNPLLHTWSLAVEEQFYLVWPVAVLIAGTRWKGAQRFAVGLLLGLGAAVSFVAAVLLLNSHQSLVFFSSPTRAWEFAVGGMAAMLPTGLRRKQASGLATMGFGMIIVAAVYYDSTTRFPGTAAILPVIGTSLMLHAGAGQRTHHLSGMLSSRPMQWLGMLSYSWYLLHWPAIVFADVLLDSRTITTGVSASLLALGLAALMHNTLENPIRHARGLVSRPRATLAFAFTLTFCSGAAAFGWRSLAASHATSDEQRAFTQASRELPKIYSDGCHADYFAIELPPCQYGVQDAPYHVVLFGDSHAAQWFPALNLVAQERSWQLTSWTKSECPFPDVSLYNARLGRVYDECANWRAATLQQIVRAEPNLVLLASAHRYASIEGSEATPSLSAWQAGTRQTVQHLTDAGIPVAILRDTPRPDFDVPSCLARREWRRWLRSRGCEFLPEARFESLVHGFALQLAEAFPTVSVIDLNAYICGATPCPVMRDDTVLYMDSNHLTTRYSISLADELGAAIEAAQHKVQHASSHTVDAIASSSDPASR